MRMRDLNETFIEYPCLYARRSLSFFLTAYSSLLLLDNHRFLTLGVEVALRWQDTTKNAVCTNMIVSSTVLRNGRADRVGPYQASRKD